MRIIIRYLICAFIGYLIGCINFANLFAKWRGVDIRNTGSKNPGASNALITIGKRIGILVGALDIFKAALAITIMRYVFYESEYVWAVAGAFCVIGHIFPYWMELRGGKGFASYVGIILAYDWRLFIIFGLAIIIITVLSDYIVIATAAICIAFPICIALFDGVWGHERDLISAAIILVVSIIILFKHRKNFIKIYRGEEIGLRAAVSKKHQSEDDADKTQE